MQRAEGACSLRPYSTRISVSCQRPIRKDAGAALSPCVLFALTGGETGIRTLGRGITPFNRLAGGSDRPLWHLPWQEITPNLRRERDSNPRWDKPTTVFKTAAIGRSAIPPMRRVCLHERTKYKQVVVQSQTNLVLAPTHRYQVVQAILTKGGAPLVKELWAQLHQEEHRLWPIWPTGKYTL